MHNTNIIVAQSGGPTSAINSSLAGVIQKAIESNIKIYGSFYGIEGILNDKITLLNNQFKKQKDIENLKYTPAMALGSCRYKLSNSKKEFDIIINRFKQYNIGYFLYIGGNDSMDTVNKIAKYFKEIKLDIKVIGIPKTIDNDLILTDHTPGFGSAAKYIATTITELIRDISIYNISSVTIVEVMGRNTGWLTLAAGIPFFLNRLQPEIICIPEVPFCEKDFLKRINQGITNNTPIIAVVSEGLKNKNGSYLGEDCKSGVVDTFGHTYLSGVGKYLENIVKKNIGCKVRSIELNLMQRCSAHLSSKTDLDEAFNIGYDGVTNALNGKTGIAMVYNRISSSPYNITNFYVDVDLIANKEKKVPDKWFDLYNPEIQKEILDYILPLIKGNISIKKNEFDLPIYKIINKTL